MVGEAWLPATEGEEAMTPFRRSAASTRARYMKLGLCGDCGAGWRRDGDRILIQPHHMGCPTLRKIVQIERSGVCATCGATKKQSLAWHESMGMAVKASECPKGCSRSTAIVGAESLTKAERSELGLVLRGSLPTRKKAR